MDRVWAIVRRNRTLMRELVFFVVVGVANTAVFFVSYNLLRGAMSPFEANALAVVIGALLSFYANRRYTFRLRGRERTGRQLVEFAIVFGVTLLVQSAALGVLTRIDPTPSRLAENITLLVGSGVALTARFLLLRHWVFRAGRYESTTVSEPEQVSG